MVESLMKAIAALGEHASNLERQLDIKEFAIKQEREARLKAEAELEELKSKKLKKALED